MSARGRPWPRRSLLAARPGPRDASIAHQAAAIVLRDFGDVRAAIRELRLAARLARATAEPDREADVLTSLGTALVMAGRTQAGLAALDEALARAASGAARGRILVRRGGSLHIAGRYDEARADLRKAITLTRRSGEVLWEARARTAAGLADLAVGATARAEAGFLAAESLFAGTGQRLEIAYARQNRALAAFAAGDLPADALAGVEAALAGRITATKRAELRLAAARIALAAGRLGQAAERARLAHSMFGTQQREWWPRGASPRGQPAARLRRARRASAGARVRPRGGLAGHGAAGGTGRRPGGDRGRLVLHRPGRVITPSQGRRTPGDGGVETADVVSSTSPASASSRPGGRPAARRACSTTKVAWIRHHSRCWVRNAERAIMARSAA